MISNNLSALLPVLEEEGFETRLVSPEEDGEAPSDQLLVALPDEHRPWDWHLELMFLPDLVEPVVLQVFCLLPFQPNPASVGDLARFLMALNNHMPITGFELSESDGWIFFRHMLACTVAGVDSNLLVDVIWMTSYLVDRFGSHIQGIAAGNQSLAQALAALEDNLEKDAQAG